MSQNCTPQATLNPNEISFLAFQLWEKADRPAGRDVEFWLAAETQLLPPQRPEAVRMQPVAAKPAFERVSRVQSNKARQLVQRN